MECPESENDEPAPSTSKQDRQELKREIFDFAKLVVWFLIIFLTLKTFVIEGYEVEGKSMLPSLEDNERILVFKLPHMLSRIPPFRGLNALSPGDIVVFDSPYNPRKRFVKRIIAKSPSRAGGKTVAATSGQETPNPSSIKVEFREGDVYVNNRKVPEDYLSPAARSSKDTQTLYLEPGEYYVLGDNRPVSDDSRRFNAITDDMMIGKAILRFWPPRKISLLN